METIKGLYGDVENLSGFSHPKYGQTRFMPNGTLVELAEAIAGYIEASQFRSIVVSETGARPLAYICERLLKQRGVDAKWTYMKFPREPVQSIYPLIMFYLSEDEKEEEIKDGKRKDIIKGICESMPAAVLVPSRKPLEQLLAEAGKCRQNAWQRQMSDALCGTKIAGIAGSPLLYFDEYVDSGTTLQNANMYLGFFTNELDFRIVSYYMNIAESSRFAGVFCTLFDQSSQEKYFEAGAYPFENRLDIIGYFYYMDRDSYAKITLENIKSRFEGCVQADPLGFLKQLSEVIDSRSIVSSVKSNFEVPAVRAYIGKKHVTRQFLLALEEETHGKGIISEFLWQLADMYGPIWSPMPKENHFDFFQGTQKSETVVKGVKEFGELKRKYIEARAGIIAQAAEACLMRKDSWLKSINALLER